MRVWAACPGRTESEFSQRRARRPRAHGAGPQGRADRRRWSGRSSAGSTAARRSCCPTSTAWAVGRAGALAPRAVRLAVMAPVRRRLLRRARSHRSPRSGRDRLNSIGSLTERTKWFPLPLALSSSGERLGVGLARGTRSVATVRPPMSQTAQTTRIRAAGAGLGRRSVGSRPRLPLRGGVQSRAPRRPRRRPGAPFGSAVVVPYRISPARSLGKQLERKETGATSRGRSWSWAVGCHGFRTRTPCEGTEPLRRTGSEYGTRGTPDQIVRKPKASPVRLSRSQRKPSFP